MIQQKIFIYKLTFLAELFGSLINHSQLSKFQLLLTLVWPMWRMAELKCNTCDAGCVPCEFQLRLTCEIALFTASYYDGASQKPSVSAIPEDANLFKNMLHKL